MNSIEKKKLSRSLQAKEKLGNQYFIYPNVNRLVPDKPSGYFFVLNLRKILFFTVLRCVTFGKRFSISQLR